MEKKHRFILNFFTRIILIIIASTLIPGIIWWLSPEKENDVMVLSGAETLASWPFINRKYRRIEVYGNHVEAAESEGEKNFLMISRFDSAYADDITAISAADFICDESVDSTVTFFDGSALVNKVNTLFRLRLETFLGVSSSDWSIRYYRSTEDSDNPVLILSSRSGETLELRSGSDFSGKAPIAFFDGRKAGIYGWIPLYIPSEETERLGSIDLHLTEQGKEKFAELGLPVIPDLAFRKKTEMGERWLFSLPLNKNLVNPGSAKSRLKEWFYSNIALFRPDLEDQLFWRIYLPILALAEDNAHSTADAVRIEENTFQVSDAGFSLSGGTKERNIYLKGVNLGAALPGRWFTQFPEDEELYLRWFEEMKEMNLNTVRIYTLFPPSFYRALYIFNRKREDDPLFLIQEIWPEEHPPGNNLLDETYMTEFEKEIVRGIDALHGNAVIDMREGRAWGRYNRDVSSWALAFLIGRELEPQEVQTTDERNRGYIYDGTYISSNGSPSEAWLARSCDVAARYEKNKYGIFRPVGIVSWPTLDPLHHPVEWTDPGLDGKSPFNDSAQIDIGNLSVSSDFLPGLFGAYHIYPNYPDFMNNQDSYASYRDEEGVFSYGGYLKEFMAQHGTYPAIVAEYGLSTSLATAHYNPQGYNHGGVPEENQAEGIIRMAEAIRNEGFSGSIIFEWIDEWAKKTWTTEPFMIPYDRQNLWHNVLDPEQNYGVKAMRAASFLGHKSYNDEESGMKVSLSGDEAFLHIDIKNIPEEFNTETKLLLGLDTYSRENGIRFFPDQTLPPTIGAMEFLLEIDEEVRITAAESYNRGLNRYSSESFDGQIFKPVSLLVNRSYKDSFGKIVEDQYTGPGKILIWKENAEISLSVPWGILNISDPSSGLVLDDRSIRYAYPLRDTLNTIKSEGILLFGAFVNIEGMGELIFPLKNGEYTSELLYEWENWNVPQYKEEWKESYRELKEYFGR